MLGDPDFVVRLAIYVAGVCSGVTLGFLVGALWMMYRVKQ